MKQVSAGVIIMTDDEQLLVAHPTNQIFWDIFKGMIEPKNETAVVAALRELREESGIVLLEKDLIDLGQHPYNKTKDLHLFLLKVSDISIIDVTSCSCSSMVEIDGQDSFPEMDEFKWMSFSTFLSNAAPSMNKLMKTLIKSNVLPITWNDSLDVKPVDFKKLAFPKKM